MSSSDVSVLIPGFFEKLQGTTDVRCKQCGTRIKRTKKGGARLINANLTQHLRRQDHFRALKRYEDALGAKKEEEAAAEPVAVPQPTAATSGQMSIAEAFSRKQPYARGSTSYEKFHRLLTKFLVEEGLPFNLAEKPSLAKLLYFVSEGKAVPNSRKFYRGKAEELYKEGVEETRRLLQEAEPFVSLTSDGWSHLSSKTSFVSITASLTHSGKRTKLCLSALPLEEAHTGEYIAQRLKEGLTFWKIEPQYLTSITTDNEAKMLKAVKLLQVDYPGLFHIRCWEHSAELLLTDGLKAQPKATALLTKVKANCSHFNHSVESARRLEEIQRKEDLPVLRIKGFNEVRWECEEAALDRILACEDALRILCAQRGNKVPHTFTDEDFVYMRELRNYLNIFRELRLALSDDNCTAGPMLKYLESLETAFQSKPEDPAGFASMKVAHSASLKKRFSDVYCDKDLYLLSAALDPRVRLKGMSEVEQERVLELLPHWLERAEEAYAIRRSKEDPSSAHSDENENAAPPEPAEPSAGPSRAGLSAAKAPRLEPPPSLLWPVASSSDESVAGEAGGWEAEFSRWKEEPRLKERSLDVGAFWAAQAKKPRLRPLGLLLSTISPSSVASEQMFSHAGSIVSSKRCSLKPDLIEKLVFLQKNMRVLRLD